MEKIICNKNSNVIVPYIETDDPRFNLIEGSDPAQSVFTPFKGQEGTFYFDGFYVIVTEWLLVINKYGYQSAYNLTDNRYVDRGQDDWPEDEYIAPLESAWELVTEYTHVTKEAGNAAIRSGFNSDAMGSVFRYTSKSDDIENLMGSLAMLEHLQNQENLRVSAAGDEPAEQQLPYFCYSANDEKHMIMHNLKQMQQVGADFYAFKMVRIAQVNTIVAELEAVLQTDLDEHAKIDKLHAIMNEAKQ